MKAYIYKNNELQRTEYVHGELRPYGRGKEMLKMIFKELKNIQNRDGNNYYIELKQE